MSKIRNARGRKDGNSGYTRVIGNEALGQLLSRVQATVIANGNELEKLIAERANLIEDIDLFIEEATIGTTPNGTYLCLKKTFKKSSKYTEGLKGIEPDMLVFIVEQHRECRVIELKDGDAFDTKKSLGEKEHLDQFANLFGRKVPFVVEYFICSFNQESKEQIYVGFKGMFSMEHIMTGRELCMLLGIDYDEIRKIRQKDIDDNLEYFIDEFLGIDEIRLMIKSKLKNE